MNRKLLIPIGILVVAIIGAFVLASQFDIEPTDTKIVKILEENKDDLLSINGVIGAGIARNESNNYIIGIAVYVEDNMTNVEEIPSELGGFKVFTKRISEASEFEKENMIIRKQQI